MKRYSIVRVEWDDITGHGVAGWIDDRDIKSCGPIAATTIGILVQKTKKLVLIAHSYAPELDRWCSVEAYPAGAVKSIKTIGYVYAQN